MARLAANSPLHDISGQIGKQLVFKKYGNKTVVSAYPDMSRVKPSPRQKANRSVFKDAVVYARSICRNPVLKSQYLEKVKEGESVYHYALKEYLAIHKAGK